MGVSCRSAALLVIQLLLPHSCGVTAAFGGHWLWFHLYNFKLSKSQFPLPARGRHIGIKCTNSAKGPRVAGRSDHYYSGVTVTPPWEVHVTGLSGLLEPQALCFPAPEASLSHRVTKHEPARATQ